MKRGKYNCIVLCFIFLFNSYRIECSSGFTRLFGVRNQAADVYGWAKENTRDNLRAVISFGCALGVFKYLRGTKKAGKLVAFMESSGLGTTVYQLLGLLRKFTINPLARLCPWIAKKRAIKREHTKALFRFLKSHDVKTVDQLPGDEVVRSKTDKKMMERLHAEINYGGLDIGTDWVDNLMVKNEPAYAGRVPEELVRCIAYINDPNQYQRHGATLRKGLPLVGAPGGGKTTLARLIAYYTQCPFIEDSPASLMKVFVGTGPNAIKDMFDNAESAAFAAHRKQQQEHEQEERRKIGFIAAFWRAVKHMIGEKTQDDGYIKPTILCLNELDAIAGQRGMQANDHQERRNTLLQLLNSIDEHPHVFVIGTSNEEAPFFDRALIRPGRMGAPLVIPLPNAQDRFEIIKYYLQKVPTLSPLVRIPGFVKFEWLAQLQHIKVSFDYLLPKGRTGRYAFWLSMVDRTDGFSGDELRQLFNDAEMLAGDKNAQYLGRIHLEKALENMLAEMPQDRRERCRAQRQDLSRVAGLQQGQLGTSGRAVCADTAVMDEDPSEF